LSARWLSEERFVYEFGDIRGKKAYKQRVGKYICSYQYKPTVTANVQRQQHGSKNHFGQNKQNGENTEGV